MDKENVPSGQHQAILNLSSNKWTSVNWDTMQSNCLVFTHMEQKNWLINNADDHKFVKISRTL